MTTLSLDSLLQVPAALLASPGTAVLVLLLIAAAVIDYRTFRIPNWLTVGGMLAGLAFAAIQAPAALPGLVWAVGGLAVGLFSLLPLYVLKVMGAGDVKLLAMVGAFLSLPDIVPAIACVLVTGGIVALVFASAHRALGHAIANAVATVQGMAYTIVGGARPNGRIESAMSAGKLPYGVSIAVGTIAFLAFRHWGGA